MHQLSVHPSVPDYGKKANPMKQWRPLLIASDTPRYLEIANAIKADIENGVLAPGDRLPPQRRIAQDIGVDFSTVSRGYAEATRRGYIESHVGRGTFVRPENEMPERVDPRRALEEDPMMNMPPEPDDPGLVARMQNALSMVSANLVPLLRYQSVIGTKHDRDIAARFLGQNGHKAPTDQLAITPGTHASLYAILMVLAKPGDTILCEDLTYPGIRPIAAQLGLTLIGVKSDADGMCPDALSAAIRTHAPAALYLNPTLQNPTTDTIPQSRRIALAEVLKTHGLPLIEDDAYFFVANDAPPPISQLIPGLGWHIAGISKCFGAGLRLAFTHVPKQDRMGAFSQSLRSTNVMASPLSIALLGRWIEDGTAAALQEHVRSAARDRQELAHHMLSGCTFRSAPEAFNLWLDLPNGTSRAEVIARMTHRQIGIMPSDAFTTTSPPKDAIRVCLGGPIPMEQLRNDLIALKDAALRKDWLG